jgi:sucrose-6-phosphate hydrolase SacC (GH32 family)
MLVGSGIPNYGGTALLYSSPDLIHWTYHHPFYSADLQKYPKTGEVWELPVFLPLGYDKSGVEKFILLANPWYSDGRHPYYCKYVFHWVGTWDRAHQRFVPDDEEPQVYDLGEHAIGPSGMIDPHGRVIIFTVVFDGQTTPQQTYDLGWAHNAGLPVILTLRDNGRIGVEPLPELESLREERLVAFAHKAVDEANRLLQGIGGETLEILVRFQGGAAGRYGLKLYATSDGEEETLLLYDAGRSTFLVDRSKSSLDPTAERGLVGGTLELEGQALQLRIYLDHSMLEAYANGLKSLTTRVYPSRPDALGLQIWADSRVNVESMQVWRLGSAYR